MKQFIKKMFAACGLRVEKQWLFSNRDYHLDPTYLELVHTVFSILERPRLCVIGANDGERYEPLSNYLKSSKLDRILVEPNPQAFADLKKECEGTGAHLVMAAISDRSGQSDFYVPRADNEQRSKQLGIKNQIDSLYGSMHPEILLNNMGYDGPWENVAEKITVPVITPKELLQSANFSSVDVLQIDAEGHDFVILKAFLEEGILPTLICIEHTQLRESLLPALQMIVDAGYLWHSDALNFFALKKEWSREHRDR